MTDKNVCPTFLKANGRQEIFVILRRIPTICETLSEKVCHAPTRSGKVCIGTNNAPILTIGSNYSRIY